MPEFIAGLLFIGLSAGLFLIFRSFVLWYWKVDEIVELLKDIRDK